jgi:hypothetical protein
MQQKFEDLSSSEARLRAELKDVAEQRAKIEAQKEATESERQRLAQAEVDMLRAATQALEDRAALDVHRQTEQALLLQQQAKLEEQRLALDLEWQRLHEAEAAELRARSQRMLHESEAEAKNSEEHACLEAGKTQVAAEKVWIEQERQRLQQSESAARRSTKQNAEDRANLDEQKLELEARKAKLASDELALGRERQAVIDSERDVLKRKARILDDERMAEALRESEHAALEMVKSKLAAENAILDEERRRLAEVELYLAMQQRHHMGADQNADPGPKRPLSPSRAGIHQQALTPAQLTMQTPTPFATPYSPSQVGTREQRSALSNSNVRALTPFATPWPADSPQDQLPPSGSPSQWTQMTPRAPASDAAAQLQALLRKWHAAEVTASDLLRCGTRLCEETARIEEKLR